jgi:hypothetical protein
MPPQTTRPAWRGGPERAGISMVETLTVSGYTADRATRNTLRCAGRVLGLPPKVLASLPRGELRRLVQRARGRFEREWHKASLRLDAVIAMEDALREGRLP